MADGQAIDFSQPNSPRVPVLAKGSLHRVLNTRLLFAIGYGDVGSSIYYALGVTTLYALGAAPLALALAGIVFFCTVLTYAELATAMPESGGSTTFARRAFNDLLSFIAGWALLLDYLVTIAISAYSIGPYLNNLLPGFTQHVGGQVPFTLVVLGVLLGLNIVGIRESTRVSLLLCVFDIITQVAIIGFGLVLLMEISNPEAFVSHLQQLWSHMQIGVPNAEWSPTWPQFWKGVGMAMVAYIGIESISQLAGEARHPNKTVPRAMMATMITLFVLYFGVSAVALTAMSPQQLSTEYLEDPIAGIAAAMPFGPYLAPWVGLLGATILFVAANAGLIGASRLTFAMSEHFTLTRAFYRLHPKFKTPYISLIAFTGIAGVIVLAAKNLTHIADLYNFGAMLSFALAHLSLLGLRIREPDMERPFKIGWSLRVGKYELPWTSLLGFLGTTAVWVDVILTKPAGRNLGFMWMGLGLAFYFWYRRQQKLPAAARLEIEELQMPDYQQVTFKKILVPVTGVYANETIQYAARMAKMCGAGLSAMHIMEVPPSLPLDTFFPEKLAAADSIMEKAQAIGREFEVPVEAHIRQARAAGETIVEVAKDGGYDLVIMGGRPRALPSAPGRTTFSTTVEYVIRNAPCRVWLCTKHDPTTWLGSPKPSREHG